MDTLASAGHRYTNCATNSHGHPYPLKGIGNRSCLIEDAVVIKDRDDLDGSLLDGLSPRCLQHLSHGTAALFKQLTQWYLLCEVFNHTKERRVRGGLLRT